MSLVSLKAGLLAAIGGLVLAASPASAGALADACVASGGGAVDAKTCSCLETRSAAVPADQKVMMTSFELTIKLLKGGAMPADAASTDALGKGAEAQAKYLQQCM